MRKPWHSLAAVVGTLTLTLAAPLTAQATVFGSNLIVNGDAETAPGDPGGNVVPVPGFTITGQLTAVTYDAPGGFPLASDPGPASRGLNFFAGGPSAAASSGWQSIDLSSGAGVIDAGGASFDLSAYLGGFSSQGDNARLTVTFLDGASAVLGSATIGPVSPADRAGATGLLWQETTGSVPVNTRSATIELLLTRTDGSYNDGYADNLSLVISAVPEPSEALLLSIGGLALVGWRRQNRG